MHFGLSLLRAGELTIWMRAPHIFTYYDVESGQEGDGELIRLWVVSWERQGWEARILSRADAEAHRRYIHSEKSPRVLRWLALQRAGGGMYADPDVINYGFAPADFGNCLLMLHPQGALAWMHKDVLVMEDQTMSVAEGYCVDLGARDWKKSPTVHFSREAIRDFYGGHDLPKWEAVSNCGRIF